MKMTISILLIALTVLAFNSVALAAPSAGAVVADLLVLRPLGFAGTVLGGRGFCGLSSSNLGHA